MFPAVTGCEYYSQHPNSSNTFFNKITDRSQTAQSSFFLTNLLLFYAHIHFGKVSQHVKQYRE